MRLSWKSILTHLAALAVGWVWVERVTGNHMPIAEEGDSSVRTKLGERQASTTKNTAESGHLMRWTGDLPDPVVVGRLKQESTADVADSIWNEFFAANADGNINAVERIVAEENLDLIEQFRGLIQADSEGVRDWFAGLPDDRRTRFKSLLGNSSLASAIPDDQLDSWEGIAGKEPWIEVERGRRAGRTGDLAVLNRMIDDASNNPGTGGAAGYGVSMAIATWPVDRVESLMGKLDLALPSVRLGVQNLLDRLPLEKKLRFIESLTLSADAGPADGHLRISAGLKGTGMDLEERITLIKPLHDGDLEKLAPQLISIDINRLLSGSELPEEESLRATLEKVRIGEMKADQLMVEVTSRLGELAEGREDLVREKVFQQLAKIAPDAAVAMMEGTPAKTVQEKVFSLGLDPAGFESAASILRAREPELPGDLQSRFSFWGHKSFEGLARYGDAYVSWAMTMPRSVDRDLVLSAIAIHVEKDDPQWAARLRAEKTYQSGWKPGMK
jgi:hypothetical protein